LATLPEIALEHCYLSEEEARALLEGHEETLPGGRTMHPKAQIIGILIKALRPPDAIPTPEESRAQFRKMVELLDEPAPAMARREDLTLPGPAGPMPCRLYDAAPPGEVGSRPVLLYVHGGGWVQGDLETHDGPCARIAAYSGAAVVALDYRLAPEHKFPAALEDTLAAYRWLREHANELGADATRVGVAGDSAGANLVTVLCQVCIAEDRPPPAFQVLVYPAVDLAWGSDTHRQMTDAYVLPRTRLEWYVEQYLESADLVTDPRVSPARAQKLHGQPPALIVTCGFDPLRGEGKRYADRLADSGCGVTYHEYSGQIHAFMSLARAIPEALDCQREIADFVRRRFGEAG